MTTGTMGACGVCRNSTAAPGKLRCADCAGIEKEISSELTLLERATRQAAGWGGLALTARGWKQAYRLAMRASRLAVAQGHMFKAMALRARLMAKSVEVSSESDPKVIYQ